MLGTRVYLYGVSEITDTFWGVGEPTARFIAFGSLYWGPPILGNYHVACTGLGLRAEGAVSAVASW